MPLGDAATLAAVREEGADYGRIRLWGSIAFILAAAGSGAALGWLPAAVPGGNVVLGLVLAAALVLLLACLVVPQRQAARGGGARWAALARMARDRRFWLFTAAAAMLQSSHQLYYGFGTLYWRTLGFSDAAIGGLWAEGVVAEIALFWYGGRLAARLGPLGLMALGGGAGILRWSLTGITPDLGAAAALQWLHALTFGASHLGAMYFMARTVPPAAAASAQSLYAGLSSGIGSGLVMLAAGRLYAGFGGAAYLFMAGLSALGLAGVGALALTRSRH
jgi:PPP family 3-phenylpropionic acid transporter